MIGRRLVIRVVVCVKDERKSNMNAKVLTVVALVLGAIAVCGEFANFFISKQGAVGIIGAILLAGGVISLAITQAKSRD